MWLLLALFGHLLNAFVFLTDKAFVAKLYPSPKALAFISGAAGFFTFFLFPWYLKPAGTDIILAAMGAGIISVPALIFFFQSLSREEVSRVVPSIGSLTPLFTFGLSYGILGERLGDKFLTGFILLAAGGALIALRSFNEIFLRRRYALFFLEIGAAFLFALGWVLQKYAFNGTDDFSAFLWSRVGSLGAALPLLFFAEVREKLRFAELRGKGMKTGLLYGISRIFAGVSPLVILLAISFGSATMVNALQGIQYAFLFLLALLFAKRFPAIFSEEISRNIVAQKAAATVLIISGLAFLV